MALFHDNKYLLRKSSIPIYIGHFPIVSGDDLQFTLEKNYETPLYWDGTFYIELDILDSKYYIDQAYLFTNGVSPNDQFTNIQKFSVEETTKEISLPFSLFYIRIDNYNALEAEKG